NFDSVSAAAERTGNVLSDEQLKKLQELDAKFDQLTATIAGWGKQIAVTTAGAIVDFVAGLDKIIDRTKTLAAGGLGQFFHQPNGAWPQAGGALKGTPSVV